MHVKKHAVRMHLTSSLCIVVRCHTRHASSSCLVVVHHLCAIYVDVTLHRALLRSAVVVSCRCALSLSSDKAEHCFLSKCLDELVIKNFATV